MIVNFENDMKFPLLLGPLLFLVVINDLLESIKHSNTILFADDTVIYYSGKCSIEVNGMKR